MTCIISFVRRFRTRQSVSRLGTIRVRVEGETDVGIIVVHVTTVVKVGGYMCQISHQYQTTSQTDQPAGGHEPRSGRRSYGCSASGSKDGLTQDGGHVYRLLFEF